MAEHPMVKLQSSDGQIFEWPLEAVLMSGTIKTMFDVVGDIGGDTEEVIPVMISSTVLQKVEEYCIYHLENDDNLSGEELRIWDMNLLDIDRGFLHQIIMAADYLDIEPLVDATLKVIAIDMQGKNLAEIRAMLKPIKCIFIANMLDLIANLNLD